jgi:chromosomal replication initiator protein
MTTPLPLENPAPTPDSLWQTILNALRVRVSPQAYKTWLEPIQPTALDSSALRLTVPTRFFQDWIDENYISALQAALHAATGDDRRIILSVSATQRPTRRRKTTPHHHHSPSPSPARPHPQLPPLNPRYTFDHFIVGRANQFAQAAARAVAENPASTYNPLFVYGGSGLGKTHIMQAIGNHLLLNRPDLAVFYVSAETFMNEMISSIQRNDRLAFRRKYRGMDILLLDDVHFLEGKEATQEEFFHTFNTLYDSHKQIVLTSDRSPKEIKTLQDRLLSRFEWGLVTDIQVPDLETRIAILRKKSSADGIDIPDDVTTYIAQHVNSNVRELEGSLIRLLAYASITGQDISLTLARKLLKDHLFHNAKPLSIATIQQVVADHYGLQTNDLLGPKRTKTIALPRQIAMYLSRELTKSSLVDIGRRFGGRDHTTVMHACDKLRSLQSSDPTLSETLHAIRSQLQPS